MRIDFHHGGKPAAVLIEIATNEGPAALGAGEDARGLPYCRARIEQDARGYADALGWIQLVESTDEPGGFATDPFEPLGEVSHPFCFFGFAPTLFDAPSRSTRDDLSWTARTFLAGIGEEREAFAILGFEWGFEVSDGGVTIAAPTELDPADWTDLVPILERAHPTWRYRSAWASP